MGERYKIATTDDLSEDGDRVIREIDGTEIAVFRISGEYYALANYCVHQAGPLCKGELSGQMVGGEDGWEWLYDDEERVITCPWHGWKFDVTTAENINDKRYVTPNYETEVNGDDIFVVK